MAELKYGHIRERQYGHRQTRSASSGASLWPR
jgi:hypothetical protein